MNLYLQIWTNRPLLVQLKMEQVFFFPPLLCCMWASTALCSLWWLTFRFWHIVINMFLQRTREARSCDEVFQFTIWNIQSVFLCEVYNQCFYSAAITYILSCCSYTICGLYQFLLSAGRAYGVVWAAGQDSSCFCGLMIFFILFGLTPILWYTVAQFRCHWPRST